MELYLFRIKLYQPSQYDLFDNNLSKAEIIRDIIVSVPYAELRKGHTWHIGNVKNLDHQSICFAFGKTTKSVHPYYDDQTGDFVERDYDTAPFTHVFYDLKYQVIGIARKADLAQNVKSIASQLKKLINRSEDLMSRSCEVDIIEIMDPGDFIAAINSSYNVSGFYADFGLPNPWDVQKDFHEPLERLALASNAVGGKVSVSGDNLNKECIIEMARSVASTGNKAYADLKEKKDGPKIRSYLQGNPAVVRLAGAGLSVFGKVVDRIRGEYEKIRQNSGG